MALIIADRVKETATTTGTGTFTLGGAVTGFRTFNAGIGTGNTTYYCIFLDGTNEFEVGLGTYTAPDQLARDTVLASSNSGSKVNFSQGIKSVFCTQPSSKAAYLDASGNLSITSSNITEGTNLYYTDARFDTRLATKDTADLSEGTNLYYTDARARAAISVSGNAIAYNSSTGVITASFEESPTFTGNVVVSGNLTVTGTTTWLDSTNTQISDKNIVLNYASGDSSANANGAGITIQDAVDASTDASLTWDTTLDAFKFSNNLHFNDGIQANFGTSSDLQILHDGSHSYIKDVGTGSLRIRGTDLLLESQGGETFLYAANNGAVTLYHDNSAKLATTSTGIDVTGAITADDYRTDGSNPFYLTSAADWRFRTTGGSERVRITSSGNVGIGTTSPSVPLHVEGTGNEILRLKDTDGTYTGFTMYNGATNANSRNWGLFVNGFNYGDLNFVSSTTNSGNPDISNATHVTINKDGNVGIGTNSPAVNLDVQDSSQAVIRAGDGSTVDMRMVADVSSGVGSIRTSGNTSVMGFFTGGSERARISSSGNVGIGVTNPTRKLHLDSAGTTTGAAYIYSNAVHTGVTTQSILAAYSDNASSSGTVLFVRGDGSGNLVHVKKGSADAFVIDSSQRVGIGTTSPSSLLHLESASSPTLQIKDTTNNVTFKAYAQNSNTHLANTSNHDLIIDTNNSEAIRIDTSQRVGIGTTSPSAKLHTQVTGASPAFFYGNDTWNYPVRIRNTTAGQEQNLDLKQGTGAASILTTSAALTFQTASTERARFTATGLGIGTTSPSEKLHVQMVVQDSQVHTMLELRLLLRAIIQLVQFFLSCHRILVIQVFS